MCIAHLFLYPKPPGFGIFLVKRQIAELIAIKNKAGVFRLERGNMENRVALMAIIVEDREAANELNSLLHEYGEYVIGRMGIPYHKRNISILSVALDAPGNVISSLSGKIGKLKGVNTKIAYSNVGSENG